MVGKVGANIIIDTIQKAQDPGLLLTMASMGRDPDDPFNTLLAPHGEVQFYHPQAASPAAFQAMIQAIRQTGDPNLLRQFISGVNIQTGEGGATSLNPIATDWYRRKLVDLLPAGSPLRANTTGLFGVTPSYATGHEAYAAPMFRTPEDMATLEAQRQWALGQQMGGWPAQPGPQPNTPEWFAQYAPM